MKAILTILLLSGMIAVYEAGKPMVPRYYIRETSSGEIKIYRSDQILIPEEVTKPDGRVYPVGSIPKYRIPLYRIGEGMIF